MDAPLLHLGHILIEGSPSGFTVVGQPPVGGESE